MIGGGATGGGNIEGGASGGGAREGGASGGGASGGGASGGGASGGGASGGGASGGGASGGGASGGGVREGGASGGGTRPIGGGAGIAAPGDASCRSTLTVSLLAEAAPMTSNADSACMRSPCSRLNSALSSSTCSRRLAAVFGVYHARFREPKRRVRLPVTRVRLRARLALEGASSGVSSGGCRVATISTCRRISRCGAQSSRFCGRGNGGGCGKSASTVTLEWEVCPRGRPQKALQKLLTYATRNKIILHLQRRSLQKACP